MKKILNWKKEDFGQASNYSHPFSTHIHCRERAEMVKDAIVKRIPVKDVVLLDTAGVSTMYANDGGIIVAI